MCLAMLSLTGPRQELVAGVLLRGGEWGYVAVISSIQTLFPRVCPIALPILRLARTPFEIAYMACADVGNIG